MRSSHHDLSCSSMIRRTSELICVYKCMRSWRQDVVALRASSPTLDVVSSIWSVPPSLFSLFRVFRGFPTPYVSRDRFVPCKFYRSRLRLARTSVSGFDGVSAPVVPHWSIISGFVISAWTIDSYRGFASCGMIDSFRFHFLISREDSLSPRARFLLEISSRRFLLFMSLIVGFPDSFFEVSSCPTL